MEDTFKTFATAASNPVPIEQSSYKKRISEEKKENKSYFNLYPKVVAASEKYMGLIFCICLKLKIFCTRYTIFNFLIDNLFFILNFEVILVNFIKFHFICFVRLF